MKYFFNLGNKKIIGRSYHKSHKIDDYCYICKTQLEINGSTAVGEAWCPNCREGRLSQ